MKELGRSRDFVYCLSNRKKLPCFVQRIMQLDREGERKQSSAIT